MHRFNGSQCMNDRRKNSHYLCEYLSDSTNSSWEVKDANNNVGWAVSPMWYLLIIQRPLLLLLQEGTFHPTVLDFFKMKLVSSSLSWYPVHHISGSCFKPTHHLATLTISLSVYCSICKGKTEKTICKYWLNKGHLGKPSQEATPLPPKTSI